MLSHAYTRTYDSSDQGRERPLFFIEAMIDELATAKAGRTIANDIECIKILIPGNTLTQWCGRVTDEHRQRWPEEYRAFKEGREIARHGTPLEMWPLMRPANIVELKAMGIATVEDVAALNDLDLQRVGMGARRLKEAAQAFLDDAAAVALTTKLEAENQRLENEVGALRNQVEELGKLVNGMHSQLLAAQNQPNPLAVMRPADMDPLAQAASARTPTEAGSSLAEFVEVRRRGRPPKTATLSQGTSL